MEYSTLILSLASGIGCFFYAKSKHRNPWLWMLLGLFFTIFAFLILLFLPDGTLEDELYQLKAKVRQLEAARNGEDLPTVTLTQNSPLEQSSDS